MNKEIINQLRKAGLNEKASKVYLTILEFGGGYPSAISKKAGLQRSTTYDLLQKLSEEGLVSEIEKKDKKYYQINDPDKLLKFAKNRIEKEEEKLKNVKKILPELEGLMFLSGNKPKVKFYQGLDGVMDVYSDHVNVTETYEMVAYSNAAGFMKLIPEDFKKKYYKKKQKFEIVTRGIVPDTQLDKKYNKLTYKRHGIKEKYLPKIRFVSKEIFPYEGEITMYGDNRISLINFKNNSYVGVIIEDVDLHNMMRMICELAWVGAKHF
jgi:HTH-type transcriptional regulator, sugar sensing transcriptional regulator